ncbi:MAG TPA: bifunctional helix-turn-helix transcriptional regulator/GNAT family N-acetyltransferase, partial [Gemmatimonadaceae bacterium]|nr:bifunctional helix-turn-helix transcriptional regulator/GNAT family N-acetyltransferase [Gemmatimonadaceae bacterium]
MDRDSIHDPRYWTKSTFLPTVVGMTDNAASRVAKVRRFNRFYTRQIGVLNRGFLDSEFSLTDVRVLYELRHRDRLTASVLGQELALDAAYLSRILREFERKGLLVKSPSKSDRRRTHLRLSAKGRGVFDAIEARQHMAVADMLHGLGAPEQHDVVESMQRIERLLDRPHAVEPSYTLRAPRPGDIGWIVHRHGALYHEEYGWDEQFEVLVAEIAADFAKQHDRACERCWIAEHDGEVVGSIFCVKKSKTVAKLRLLYVEPSARGMGIGSRLVAECL